MLNKLTKIKQPILITGSTGFIGSNLLNFLISKNISVHIILRKKNNLSRIRNIIKNKKIVCHFGDLEEHKKIAKIIKKIKPKTIFHLAAYGSYPHQKDFNKIKGVNYDSSINLLNQCSKYKFAKFINTGSSSEYGNKTRKMKESDKLEPVNYYGLFKAAFTLYSQIKAKTDNLPIVSVRPFHVYGPGEEKTRLIPTIIKYLKRNTCPPLVSPKITRDMIYIDDVIKFYITIASKKNINGQIFNIGSGKKYSIETIFEELKRVMNSKIKAKWLTMQNRDHDNLTWYADMSKTKQKFKFKNSYTLKSGLKKTFEHFNKE